jgi:hypothetical protein
MQPVLLASRECGRDWPMSPLSQTDGGVSHKNLKGLARWNQTNTKRERELYSEGISSTNQGMSFFFFSFYIKSNLGLLFLVLNNKKILSIFKIL